MSLIRLPQDFHHDTRLVGGLQMHLVSEGPAEGAPVIMLHGFPEFWYGWWRQIGPLAAAGYRVIVPDQRGYNLTSKHGPYDVLTLADDIRALALSLGYRKFSLVGHDWGGVVAWTFGSRYPEMLDKLVVCNVPHPGAMRRLLYRLYLPQWVRSWYVFAFQVPQVPERSLSRDNFEQAGALIKAHSLGSVTDEELAFYRAAWAQPGALTAMIDWYRASFRQRLEPGSALVPIPARLIWGEPDGALTTRSAEVTRQFVAGLDLVYIPDSCHFVQHHQSERVTQLILDYLRR